MTDININKQERSRFKSGHFWRLLNIIIIVYCTLGIAFYYLQEKFLFHPIPLCADYTYQFTRPFREVNIAINKNENLNIVQFFPQDSVRKGIVLYFHGNRQNINRYAKFADNFTRHGYEVWMPDYPGYGKTTGKITEEKLYNLASINYTLAKTKYSKHQIIIYGKSLGTGIASQLAAVKDSRLLILETPYYSIPDLFSCYAPIYPMSLMSHFEIPTYQYLPEVNAPIAIFHGTADEVIFYRCAAKLKKVLKPIDEFITIKKGKHNNLNDFDIFHHKLDSLLTPSPLVERAEVRKSKAQLLAK
jgi:alpha-beta hydrolase superfamily lysophospholipase